MTEPGNARPRGTRLAVALALAFGLAGVGRADVVPPEAVDVATKWLSLVEHGRYRDAVACCFDPREPAAARAMAAARSRDGAARPGARVVARTVTSWAGHGPGDSSRVAAGSYFALTFDTTTADGRTRTDEVRLVPYGDGGWRVVADDAGRDAAAAVTPSRRATP